MSISPIRILNIDQYSHRIEGTDLILEKKDMETKIKNINRYSQYRDGSDLILEEYITEENLYKID